MRRLILTLVFLLYVQSAWTSPLDMRLFNIDGQEEAMKDYIGKGEWVVVNVWSPTCSACVTELPRIKKFIERNPDIPMIGVTLDFPSFGYGKINVLRNFVERNPLNYPLFLADIEQASELIDKWLVAIPLIAIFHPDGRPLVRWPGVVEIHHIENFIKNYKEESDPLMEDF